MAYDDMIKKEVPDKGDKKKTAIQRRLEMRKKKEEVKK